MKRINWALQAVIFYLLTWTLSAVPPGQIRSSGCRIGGLLFRLLAKRRKIAIDNICQALPFMKKNSHWVCGQESPEEMTRDVFNNLGTSLIEICRLYHGKGLGIIDSIEIRGREHFESARAKHKGLVFVTGHCGNWELTALCFKRLFNNNMSVVARQQNNPYLNAIIEQMRKHYENSVIYKQGALKQIIGTLKKDGVVGILVDQAVFTEEGVLINVLGRKAWASKAPVVIAQKTGAPLIPAYMHRENGKNVITISPEFELSGDTSEEGIRLNVQALSRSLEDFVCAHPADWYWVHRRWKRAGEAAE